MPSIRFQLKCPKNVGRTFEKCYEEELQEDEDTLNHLHLQGRGMWLYVDNALVGETIGIAPSRLPEEIPDTKPWTDEGLNKFCLYVYTTVILPDYQDRGFAKLLCSYYAGYMKAIGYGLLIGHATSDPMRGIRSWMGASFSTEHKDWCGSQRKAVFYVQHL